eukprot:TRINITY_DN25249_c0_g1_i1.p1 TRINITY_DN25249_c0_g1~~TRINITY_DN25249_c0_g1_i1.p1  ORF type:complete len:241 (-),score=32.28 TRINITY_DN25249_c0_g1_i1:12-662(-)
MAVYFSAPAAPRLTFVQAPLVEDGVPDFELPPAFDADAADDREWRADGRIATASDSPPTATSLREPAAPPPAPRPRPLHVPEQLDFPDELNLIEELPLLPPPVIDLERTCAAAMMPWRMSDAPMSAVWDDVSPMAADGTPQLDCLGLASNRRRTFSSCSTTASTGGSISPRRKACGSSSWSMRNAGSPRGPSSFLSSCGSEKFGGAGLLMRPMLLP